MRKKQGHEYGYGAVRTLGKLIEVPASLLVVVVTVVHG